MIFTLGGVSGGAGVAAGAAALANAGGWPESTFHPNGRGTVVWWIQWVIPQSIPIPLAGLAAGPGFIVKKVHW